MTLRKITENIYLLDDSDLIHDDDFCNKCKCQSHERKIAHQHKLCKTNFSCLNSCQRVFVSETLLKLTLVHKVACHNVKNKIKLLYSPI